MIHSKIFLTAFRVAGFVSLLTCALLLLAGPGAVASTDSPTITASGSRIASVFDGRAPNDYVRDVLVLKIDRARSTNLSNLSRAEFAKGFKLLLVATPSVFFSCPTGGICGQPGTTSVPGQFCEDSSGCDVDTHNQTDTGDPTQGTMELYDCEQCCVDWAACTLDSGGGGGSGSGCGSGGGYGGNDGGGGTDGCSPIIIDAEAEGFHLTSAVAGVTFDISGSGHPVQMGWTDAHYHNAFLALPGPDGLVHSGKELFGNFTPQPPSAHPNGFIALAQYDKPENGGNGDGIIDGRDEVFSKLRLWIDENHDGVCQPNELHRLQEFGVYSLALSYTESRRKDEWGNQFRYKAVVDPGDRKDPRDETRTGEPGRWTYDVFFVVK